MCRLRSYCIWKGCLLKALPFPGLKALLLQALPLLRAPGLGLAKPFKIKLMVRTISSIESLRLVGDRGSFASVCLDFPPFFPDSLDVRTTANVYLFAAQHSNWSPGGMLSNDPIHRFSQTRRRLLVFFINFYGVVSLLQLRTSARVYRPTFNWTAGGVISPKLHVYVTRCVLTLQ